MKQYEKRLLASILAIMMMITVIPYYAFAADDNETPDRNTLICSCETKCTDAQVNENCPVCGTEGADLSACKGTEAISEPECTCKKQCTEGVQDNACEICRTDWKQCTGAPQTAFTPQQLDESNDDSTEKETRSNVEAYPVSDADELNKAITNIGNSDGNEFEIVLQNDLSGVSFAGVADKHITLKSTERNKFSISLAAELQGDITFDNVKASAGNLYCSGHKTIFTENSELTAGTVFGGGNGKTVASTYLVLNGKTHVNTANNDFNVAAGSYKASVEGDTYLEISGDFTTGNGEQGHHITGTNVHSIDGWDSYYQEKTYVGGNVTIIIDINLDHTSVFPVDGTYHSEIEGNLYMAIKSGYVQEICAQQGPFSVNQIGGDVHIVVGDPAYENTDRIVRPSGNWGIYGTGNQFAPVDYYGQLYEVGGNVRIDTYENLWAWGEYNNSYDYPPDLHGAYYGDVGGNVTVNVHGSHLRRVYGAEESEIAGNIIVNCTDAELDSKEVIDPSIPDENKNGGGVYGGPDSSCKQAVVNVDGGSMYEASMRYTDAEDGAVINITGSPSIRGAVFGHTSLYQEDQMMTLNIDDANVNIPTVLYFSDINIGEASNITVGRAATGDIPFINIYDLKVTDKAVLTTKDGNTEILGNAEINDADWFSLSEALVGGNIAGQDGTVYFKMPSSIVGDAKWDKTTLKLPAVEESGYSNYDGVTNHNIALTIGGASSGEAYVLTVDKSDAPAAVDPKLADNYILSKGDKNPSLETEIVYFLANDAKDQGYYLKCVDDPANAYSNMWQVAKATQYILTYESNGGTTFAAEKYNAGTPVTLDKVPVRDGYTFEGWYADEQLTQPVNQVVMDMSKTVYAKWEKNSSGGGGAHHPEYNPDDDEDEPEDEPEEVPEEDVPLAETPWLNTEDHYAYIIGYAEDGTVRPNANITRAEVATIFFRLLTDEARDQFWSTSNNFPDVAPNAWYNNAVSTMVNAGIIEGYEDGTFRPNNNITRAEFATIASRFMSWGYDVEEDLFTDIANHWARKNINDAAMTKWITGYPDGTFLPDRTITRAEAVTLVNNVLQRKPDADHMLDTMIKWSDNPESAWYYEAIQEATNSHDYDLFEGAEYETWTALQENRDWAALEKDWVNAHRTGGEVM